VVPPTVVPVVVALVVLPVVPAVVVDVVVAPVVVDTVVVLPVLVVVDRLGTCLLTRMICPVPWFARKTFEPLPETMSDVNPVPSELKATHVPSREIEGDVLLPVAVDAAVVVTVVPVPLVVVEVVVPAWGLLTRIVVPARRSRTKTFESLLPVLVPLVVPPVVEAVVRLSALESKATKRPSAEIAGW
jgi:hypothetical protein